MGPRVLTCPQGDGDRLLQRHAGRAPRSFPARATCSPNQTRVELSSDRPSTDQKMLFLPGLKCFLSKLLPSPPGGMCGVSPHPRGTPLSIRGSSTKGAENQNHSNDFLCAVRRAHAGPLVCPVSELSCPISWMKRLRVLEAETRLI